jgi:acyl-CoA reductase-like NAD-dependent aldehyde dehydrogenase
VTSLDLRATAAAQERGAPRAHPDVHHWIGGQSVAGGPRFLDVLNPSTGAVISRVPVGGAAEVDQAVTAARRAFPGWAATPIKERVQVFYRYKALLEKNITELGELVTAENGKVRGEAEADPRSAIELTEFACSLPRLPSGGQEVSWCGMPPGAASARRRRLDQSVQLPIDGAALVPGERHRPRQHLHHKPSKRCR